jgi:hypothetical protein
MAEKLVHQLFDKARESCLDCYLYSRIDPDKRDRYNEHALSAIIAIANNENAEFYERECSKNSFRRCASCRYNSPRIKRCIDEELHSDDPR